MRSAKPCRISTRNAKDGKVGKTTVVGQFLRDLLGKVFPQAQASAGVDARASAEPPREIRIPDPAPAAYAELVSADEANTPGPAIELKVEALDEILPAGLAVTEKVVEAEPGFPTIWARTRLTRFGPPSYIQRSRSDESGNNHEIRSC